MADPLSIAASIAGLISITVEAGKFLSPYVSAAKETPQVAAHVFSEIQSTQVILQGLQSLIKNFASVKVHHAALIGLDQVVTILTDGVLLFSELQSELRSLPPKDESGEKISLRARMQWARKEGSFNTFITRLQSFKTSMTLVLMILKSDSDRSAAEHHERLTNSIKTLLETNHALSHRLMSLEDGLETQTVVTKRRSLLSLRRRTSSSSEQRNTGPTTAPPPPNMERESGLSKLNFRDDLISSRVYRRAQRETMDFSFRSSIAQSRSWSMFTGLSLSDISAISVIALPVYPDDLTNAHHYDFGETPTITTTALKSIPVDEGPEFTKLQPLILECQDIIHSMLQIPGLVECFHMVDPISDPFHLLWSVLRETASLLVLVRALDPLVDSPFEESWHMSSRHEWKRVVLWFVVYCRDNLGVPIDSLFTIRDLASLDFYGFSKAIRVISLIIEMLQNRGIVQGNTPKLPWDRLTSTPEVVRLWSNEREFVNRIGGVVDIMNRSALDDIWDGDDDIPLVAGLFKKLAHNHITILVLMERNLLLSPPEQKWVPVFKYYQDSIDTEALLIEIEPTFKAKLRSVIAIRRDKGEDGIKPLLECITILPIMHGLIDVYQEFLEETGEVFAAQLDDIINAQSLVEQAASRIVKAREAGKAREVARDLDRRILSWDGLSPHSFGELHFYNFANVKLGTEVLPCRLYLFKNSLLICNEVYNKPQRGYSIFNRSSSAKSGVIVHQAKLSVAVHIPLEDIVSTSAIASDESFTLKITETYDRHSRMPKHIGLGYTFEDSKPGILKLTELGFTTDTQMMLWASKVEETRAKVIWI